MMWVVSDPNIGKTVGAKIARVMASLRLTQGQVAAKADLSQPTVSALVGGMTKDPPLSTVLKVAKALELSIDELLDLAPASEALAQALAAPLPANSLVERLSDRVNSLEMELLETARIQRTILDELRSAQAAQQEPQKGYYILDAPSGGAALRGCRDRAAPIGRLAAETLNWEVRPGTSWPLRPALGACACFVNRSKC